MISIKLEDERGGCVKKKGGGSCLKSGWRGSKIRKVRKILEEGGIDKKRSEKEEACGIKTKGGGVGWYLFWWGILKKIWAR